jgi:large subunit ribosomal protein L4
MATIDLYNLQKQKVGELALDDTIFNAEVKEYLIHEAVKIFLANRRAGTVAVKTRAQVSGGGRKPYKQKGTGNARQGCIRAPHYPGGGVAHGPKAKDYSLAMNKKARKAAIRSALSLRFKDSQMTVLDSFNLADISTKGFVGVLNQFELGKSLVVIDGSNNNLELSARNVKDVKVTKVEAINIFDIMKYPNIIFTQDAVRKVEGALQS